MKSFEQQAAFIIKDMKKKLENLNEAEKKYVVACVSEIERTAKTLMRDTVTNPNVTYHRKHRPHHPSVEGNPPAVDYGTLRRSVTHTIGEENGKPYALVGTDLDYGRCLEFGTSKMKPRPWLSLATIKCADFMRQAREQILGKAIKG